MGIDLSVTVDTKTVAKAMLSDAEFGGDVLTEFLKELGRHPGEFARRTNLKACRIMTAGQLRELADAIEKS